MGARTGAEFFDAVEKALGGLPFIAEDLGTITDDVRELLALFKFRRWVCCSLHLIAT